MEAERDKARREFDALANREAELRAELERIQNKLRGIHGWGGSTFRNLNDEIADVDLVAVDGGDRDDYVIVTLTRAQVVVRKYGSGPSGPDTIIRAGAKWAPVSLEQCRAAWVAAGRRLP